MTQTPERPSRCVGTQVPRKEDAEFIAEAVLEEAVYDENGTLLTSSMSRYLVPMATDAPLLIVGRSVTPSTTNELKVMGVSETGTIASPPAVINARSHLGVTDVPSPASPEKFWPATREWVR